MGTIETQLSSRFLNWFGTKDGGKMPCDLNGIPCNAHDPANHVDYATALDATRKARSNRGVAYALDDSDGWFFLDMDKCLGEDGKWSPEATSIFTSFKGAWGEVSQSGKGMHVMGRCDPSRLTGLKRKWKGWLELYTGGRFIAFGPYGWKPIGGTATDKDFTDHILSLVPEKETLADIPEGVDPAYTGPQDDDRLIEMMKRSRGSAAAAFGDGVTFKDLWEANADALGRKWPAFNEKHLFDHSSADMALMMHLAFWTGRDQPRMDRLFRRSALVRDKYLSRADYRRDTISNAAKGTRNVYNVQPAPAPNPESGASPSIEIGSGEMHTAVTETLQILRDDPLTFDFGASLVTIDRGRVFPLDKDSLAHHVGQRINFVKFDGRVKDYRRIDPPLPLVKQIIAFGPRRSLKLLTGVVSAPIITTDGSVLCEAGFDERTGLFFSGDRVMVPAQPSRGDVECAIEVLMKPFRNFPFENSLARSALMCALLTAAVRPVIPTTPAFAIDAPTQGSGKTLLAKCIGALVSGVSPDIWPHTRGRDDEETRKRLLAALSTGTNVLIWDNVIGVFDSASLASLLTSETMTDRLLGKTETASFPNRAVIILTGNNITLAGDMARRVISVRIDPKTERAFEREFAVDPLRHVLDNRVRMMVAACTLIRARLQSGDERVPGALASFEDWDRLVRQTVAWLPGYDDPIQLVRANQDSEPEREALQNLLATFYSRFGQETFAASDLRSDLGSNTVLGQALFDLAGEVKSVRSLGMVLRNRVGRVSGGLRLEGHTNTATNHKLYKVIKFDGTTGTTGTISSQCGNLPSNDNL